MGRAPCCDKANVKKGPWSPEEDSKLKDYIEKNGTGGNWISLPQKAGLRRCGKSCRLRWLNYLRPNIKHGEFSDEEDRIICTLYANIGSSSSDGSSLGKQEEIIGFQNFMQSCHNKLINTSHHGSDGRGEYLVDVNHWENEKMNLCFGQYQKQISTTALDYDLEYIKQLISCNNGNYLSIDENKMKDEKTMYYY
ncbi:hypothetical protein TSUD_107590 [Trifolium subterraneum]|uniref:Uncharacterized protein n=1 Tax=Trifolium subterraneum TaxID=3900 RepID=A0A2Z6NYF2_TRISU|nr:hypothetical protein TSUD_107590 [Trifolium subterraneum]